DLGLALVVELHRPAEQRNDLGRHDVEAADVARIAAGADAAEIVGAHVEQAAIIVAHGEPELALAEEVLRRIGRLVARELRYALVDPGQVDVGLLVVEVGDLDRPLEALAGRHLLGRADLDPERAQRRVDAQPHRADGAGRRAIGLYRQRPPGADQRIGAGAPFLLDRDLDRGAGGRYCHRVGGDDAVGGDGDQRFAGKGWLDAQARAV